MEKYSFLASVYKNTKINEMKECLASCVNQTCPPDQIVIVVDGEIPTDLKEYLDDVQTQNEELYTIVPLSENVGLGRALNEGMSHCRNEFVARIDTDDICELDRVEKQLKAFEQDSEVSIVGSNIEEFCETIDNVIACRNVPETHEEICEYLKSRCPFNHMTVLFKKSEVEKAGGYQHWYLDEDSYLWVRMYLADCKFYNIQENLVHARVDLNTYSRRGGYKYYKSERDLFKFMYKNKIISWFEYQKAKFIRLVVQVLMPNFVRQWFFKRFARNKISRG